ncbi:MAG: DUF3365 domain-containing protein [Proteobacteria bacterium]|nr:DUF3365 domain-containing protein [Pseudomonadota bacterium]MBU1059137.1 DUF3365 domain-containing protein [Pseudomonadota bacterium]
MKRFDLKQPAAFFPARGHHKTNDVMTEASPPRKPSFPLQRNAIILATAWTALIILGASWHLFEAYQNTLKSAYISATRSIEKDLTYRRWAAGHGGVYVPVTEETPPNPFLSHLANRDVTTTSGQKLTLINPAYMTRQAYTIGHKYYGHQDHITSLKPLRPENSPDIWETKALQAFAQDKTEVSEPAKIGTTDYLRLMRPLTIETTCLKCHASQGYKVGDLRGGISISVPLQPWWRLMYTHATAAIMSYALALLLGLFGIRFATLRIGQHIRMRDQAEEELQKALTEYADLYNNALDMLVSVDTDNARVIQCNQTLLANLGYSRTEIIGHPIFDLYHPNCLEEIKNDIFPTFLKTGVITNKELKLKRKDGSFLSVILNLSAIRDKDGRIIQSRSVLHDITEQKWMRKQFIISEKMTTIAGLAAGVAHEINTPLSGILQSIQLIEMGLDPEQEQNRSLAADCGIELPNVQRYLQKKELDFFLNGIKSSATTAAHIISDLLQFSRPQVSERTSVNLAELIDRSIELTKTDYSLKKEYNILNVEFIRNYSPELPEVNCMAMEIEQVLINLIKNSCQAMAGEGGPTAPHIIVRTKQKDKMAVIEVEDNGPGIEEKISRQIFDPFFTTKDIGKGTGLGLATSYSIICDRHGGTLEVTSRPDNETKFIIELPLTGVSRSNKND